MKKLKEFKLFFFLGITALILVIAVSCDDNMVGKDDAASLKGTGAARPSKVIGIPDANGNVFITANRTLYRDTCYTLQGFVRVLDGVTLTIQSGTHILGASDYPETQVVDPATLIVERGGKIQAVGTPLCPIIFSGVNKQYGAWGGIVILGRAYNNLPGGLGEIEGLPNPGTTQGFYGADLAGGETFLNTDNSGTLQYVRIEYAGHSIDEANGNETNGLTMGSVGSGTTIDHVQITSGNDDGFEWFGGTVNAKYLIAVGNRDDDFDTDQGYSGKVQFGIAIRCNTNNITVSPVNGFESNGDEDDSDENFTKAIFSNFTILGPVTPTANANSVHANYNSGILIRDGSQIDVYNTVVTGYPNYQLQGELPQAQTDFNAQDIKLKGIVLVSPVGATGGTNLTGFTTAAYNNQVLAATSTTIGLTSLDAVAGLPLGAWNCPGCGGAAPNLVPDNDVPLIENEETEAPAYYNLNAEDNFFTATAFVGAFGRTANENQGWEYSSGWINWNPSCETYCGDAVCGQ